jgi:hypothetical protein
MYGFCYATLIGKTPEEVERMVDEYRKYPFFDGGVVRETAGKFKHRGEYMAIVSYFNND